MHTITCLFSAIIVKVARDNMELDKLFKWDHHSPILQKNVFVNFVPQMLMGATISYFGTSLYRRRTENCTQAFKWHQFQWSWVTSKPDFKVRILFNVK